ncbi:MAG TPA: lytic transglycosylase domain-containing protein [Xanthobacteraceae bacterium]|nr:lytic transglycosylase domain-containing protein [Xanthobacteraceae bacterium]
MPRPLARDSIALLLLVVSAAAPARAQNAADLATVKQAIQYLKQSDGVKALAVAAQAQDPAARALVTWLAIRTTTKDVGFDRTAQFLRERPNWPNQVLIRRRAEKMLYDEERDAATVRAFFAQTRPLTGEGKLALAKVLAAGGDQNGAAALVRAAWREDELSGDSEKDLLTSFPGVLTRADHKARADRLFGQEKPDPALRAAKLAGGDIAALGEARAAIAKRAGNAAKLLDAVPASARSDQGYVLARVQLARRKDDAVAAARMLADAPRDPKLIVAPDQWWLERRIVVRKLLDAGDARGAYRVAAEAAVPESENYKADQQFTAGWISLRFLNDLATAKRHFTALTTLSVHPVTVSRAYYWLGRTQEAEGDRIGARLSFEAAARHTVTYYGQLARAHLGLKDLPLPPLSQPPAAERAGFEQQEPVRALRMLYAIGESEFAIPIYTDLSDRAGTDAAGYLLLADVATEARDARALVLLGKSAMAKGVPVEMIGFPAFGVPNYNHVGPQAEPAIVYAIARQESQFDQRSLSIANAKGLMQVIPSTARAIARKFGIPWDDKKLAADPVFNVQLGAAELGDLLEFYRGNPVLTFIGYNAGRGRAAEWIAKYGDPRDPKVDVVDWIERIPISETRFYVQRVMENMQVYQTLAGGHQGLTIEADLVRGRLN